MKILLKRYLPPLLFEDKGLLYASTIVFIAFIMLVVDFFGWQQPFIKFTTESGLVEFEDANSMFFMAQVYTSISFALLFFLLPLVFNYLFPIDKTNNNVGLSLPKKGRLLKIMCPW